MKRTFAWIMAAVILTTSLSAVLTGCSDAVEEFEVIDAGSLPSKVDLRDFDGKNYVTPVKSQRFGDCWAFSLAGAAEIAYLYANDMGVPAGQVNDRVDFSEKYIVWYLFHGITEDDVCTGKVRSSQVGEGFDPSKAESKFALTPYIIGGPFVHDANLFGAGFGPVDESAEVGGEYPYAYNDLWEGEWTLPLNAAYRNAPATGRLRHSIVLQSPAQIDKDGNYTFDETNLNIMKSEISRGHGVSLGFCSVGRRREDTRGMYHGSVMTPDHAVVVVGYDDDFPKENFTLTYNTGEVIEGSTPPGDGAFIIKNSWGTVNSEEDGYFYLSYYDQTIVSPLSYTFDNDASVKHDTLYYDQYDLMMTNWYCCTDHDAETKMANVFDAEQDESLCQIAYVTSSMKTEVSYEIYKDVEEDDPSSGKLLEKGVHRHTSPGYYRIDLKGEYALKKGDRYAVVLTMQRLADEDGNMTYTEVFPCSTEFYDGMTVSGVIRQGESYLYTDGRWRDMYRAQGSLIDRAYHHLEEVFLFDPTLPEVDLSGKDKIAVDNYPIKAILAPNKTE